MDDRVSRDDGLVPDGHAHEDRGFVGDPYVLPDLNRGSLDILVEERTVVVMEVTRVNDGHELIGRSHATKANPLRTMDDVVVRNDVVTHEDEMTGDVEDRALPDARSGTQLDSAAPELDCHRILDPDARTNPKGVGGPAVHVDAEPGAEANIGGDVNHDPGPLEDDNYSEPGQYQPSSERAPKLKQTAHHPIMPGHPDPRVPMPGRVGVAVVAFNSEQSIGSCLKSVPSDLPVIVVDNASGDATVEAVLQARPAAQLIRQPTNLGFARAVNLALSHLPPSEFVLLLNPDARLAGDCVEKLVDFMDGHPSAAVVSAAIIGSDGRPEPVSTGREPSLVSIMVHYWGLGFLFPGWSLYRPAPRAGAERRDWVAATAVLARSEAVELVGGLDESFFLYCEDIDWCRRLRQAGWEVWVTAAARAVHERSSSVDAAGAWVDRYRIGSLDLYFARHHRGASVGIFRLSRAAGLAARGAVFLISGSLTGRPDLMARGRHRLVDARLSVLGMRIMDKTEERPESTL